MGGHSGGTDYRKGLWQGSDNENIRKKTAFAGCAVRDGAGPDFCAGPEPVLSWPAVCRVRVPGEKWVQRGFQPLEPVGQIQGSERKEMRHASGAKCDIANGGWYWGL